MLVQKPKICAIKIKIHKIHAFLKNETKKICDRNSR